MIVVLDTNVLVRAAFRRLNDPDNLVVRIRRGEFETAVSSATIRELEITLSRERLSRLLRWAPSEQDTFVADYVALSQREEPTITLTVCRDPADNRFIELAVEVEASYIVSGDDDLLDLGEYAGIPIVNEAQFVAILREAP